VHAEIEVPSGASGSRDLLERGTGNHDAAAGRHAIERPQRSLVRGATHPDVVHVDHHDAIRREKSQTLGCRHAALTIPSSAVHTARDLGAHAWEVTVPGEGSGARLDVFLARSLDLSRGYARRLLERGGIRLNGAPAAKGARVQPGDVVSGPPFRHPSEGPLASPGLEVRILAEKGGLLAVDKPAGVPTHPLDFDERGTVLSALLARYPEMSGVGEGGLRSGVVHRLDVGTSGVLVFARETEAWTRAR
jgi:hypothetical protein